MKTTSMFWGDKYEIKESVVAGLKTNNQALVCIFIFITSFSIESLLRKIIGNNSFIPQLVFILIWLITTLFVVYLFTKKLIKNKVVDLYLIAVAITAIISFISFYTFVIG